MMVMMSMTMAFAENEEENATTSMEAYSINVNMHSLARALNLNSDQIEYMDDVMSAFSSEMNSVPFASADSRKAMVNNIVKKNLSTTRSVLNSAQYRKYLMLLNATLNNRGLNK